MVDIRVLSNASIVGSSYSHEVSRTSASSTLDTLTNKTILSSTSSSVSDRAVLSDTLKPHPSLSSRMVSSKSSTPSKSLSSPPLPSRTRSPTLGTANAMSNTHRTDAAFQRDRTPSSESIIRGLIRREVGSEHRQLKRPSVIGIAIGVAILLLAVASVVFVVRRRRRRRAFSTMLPKLVVSRLGWRDSADSESLTSFDTSTDTGGGTRRQAHLLNKTLREAINDTKHYESTQKLLATARSPKEMHVSTTDVPQLQPWMAVLSRSQEAYYSRQKTYSDDTCVSSQSSKEVKDMYSINPSRYASSPPSIPDATRPGVPIPNLYKHVSSISDSAAVCQRSSRLRRIDEMQLSARSTDSFSLCPDHGSPHSMSASCITAPFVFPRPGQGSKLHSSGFGSSKTTSIRLNAKVDNNTLHTTFRPEIYTTSDLGFKPLPPYPQAQASSLYAQNPWATSISPPKAHVSGRPLPLDRALCLATVKNAEVDNTMLKHKSRPFRELLSPSARTHKRSVSTSSTRRQFTGPRIHVSTMARRLPAVPAIQSPKPVLKLDTSGVKQEAYLRPACCSSRSNPGAMLSPMTNSAVHSAPADFRSQHAQVFRKPLDQSAASRPEPKRSFWADLRPSSNAATIGSLVLHRADNMSETFLDDDTAITPTTPLRSTHHSKLRQFRITTWKSASTATFNALGYASRSNSQSYPTDDECDSDSRRSRSSSVAVPIVFKLSFPRKSSRNFNAMSWE